MQVIISGGSNISPIENIPKALSLLREMVEIKKVSSYYITDPIGNDDEISEQDQYVNFAVLIHTDISAKELKYNVLRVIERKLGRKRCENKFASREIDLDIVFFGNLIIKQNDIQIPDDAFLKYAHVYFPVVEICPNFIHPVLHKSLQSCEQFSQNSFSKIELDTDI